MAKAKRESVCRKIWLDGEGEEITGRDKASQSTPVGVRFAFKGGHAEDVYLGDLPEEIQTCCGIHGLAQGLGDAYASSEGNVDTAIEKFQAKLELYQAGTWAESGGGGGPRISVLLEAIGRVLSDAGKAPTDEEQAARRTRLGADEDYRKASAANPLVAAAVAKINAENAAKRAKDLMAKAKGEPESDLSAL